jgi:hypothetical protein
MFRAVFVPIIRSFSAVQRRWYNLCSSVIELHKLYQCRCTAEKLLMMGTKTARNMKSYHTNNKTGTQWVCWFYSQGIYHDAQS